MVLDISLPGFLEDLLSYTLYSSFLFYNQYRIFYMCKQINSSSSSTAKGKAKRVVARVKAEAIDIPYMINWKLLKDSKRVVARVKAEAIDIPYMINWKLLKDSKSVVARVKAEPYMINWKLLKDSKRYIELQLKGTDQARTFARYAISEVQQEKFYEG